MDFKMADTSERRVFCNTILLKYHGEGMQRAHEYKLRNKEIKSSGRVEGIMTESEVWKVISMLHISYTVAQI